MNEPTKKLILSLSILAYLFFVNAELFFNFDLDYWKVLILNLASCGIGFLIPEAFYRKK